MRRALALLVLGAATLAAQTEGVMPIWEVQKAGSELEKHTKVIEGLLEQYRAEEWVKGGAPGVYVEQLKQARQYNSYVNQQARELTRDPEKLSLVLDLIFRLEHAHSLLQSVTQGMSLHQNAAVAALTYAELSRNSTIGQQLKQYAYQLTLDREKEWEIADREAQRCRESLAKRPPSAPAKKTAAPPPAAPPKP
jgi:hypothetical protein